MGGGKENQVAWNFIHPWFQNAAISDQSRLDEHRMLIDDLGIKVNNNNNTFKVR